MDDQNGFPQIPAGFLGFSYALGNALRQQQYNSWVQTFLIRGATMEQARYMAWVEMGGPQSLARSVRQRLFWWAVASVFLVWVAFASIKTGGFLIAGIPALFCMAMWGRAWDDRKKLNGTQAGISS